MQKSKTKTKVFEIGRKMHNFKNFKSKKIQLNSHSKVSSAHKFETFNRGIEQIKKKERNELVTLFAQFCLLGRKFANQFCW